MRPSVRTIALALLGAFSALACSARPGSPIHTGFAKYVGAYRFEEQVSPGVHLDGRFMVQADTIEVELKTADCRSETSVSPQRLTYSCGPEVRISFERFNPIQRAFYAANVLITETRRVCARYVKDNHGERVCAEYRSESYQRAVTRSGRLRPVKIENAEWGSQ